jgi:hypothetical protein
MPMKVTETKIAFCGRVEKPLFRVEARTVPAT